MTVKAGFESMNDHPGPEGLLNQMESGIYVDNLSAKIEKALGILRSRNNQLQAMAEEAKRSFEETAKAISAQARKNQILADKILKARG